jgi:putative transposase
MAEENKSWGYDRIVGALANLGHEVSDQTVGNVLRRHGVPPAPQRNHFASREVEIAGITAHPTEQWMKQMARNVTMEGCGALGDSRYLLHDRDTKYAASFLAIIKSGGVKTLRLPAGSPNLNAYSERWVRSAKEECLSKLVLFGERSLRRAMREYVVHYHAERNHQGKSNILLFPQVTEIRCEKTVECRQRLGGLLRYYHREAVVSWRASLGRWLWGCDHAETNTLLMATN